MLCYCPLVRLRQTKHQHIGGQQQSYIPWQRYISPNIALCYKSTQKFYCEWGAALSTIITSFGKSKRDRKMRISS